MASFQLLEPREEDELHKLRLLNVEEKPFKRISRRLLAPSSLLTTPLKLPTPPPDTFSNDSENHDLNQEKVNDERRQFKEDILFDFGAFNNSLIRIQFLQDSNKRERQRYKADKERILETAQQVRENTVQLRIQLEEAKQTLEQRKKFDELAEKITGNRLLRPSFLGSEKREDEAKIEDSIMIDASGVVSHEIESETEVEVTSKGVEGAEKMNIV